MTIAPQSHDTVESQLNTILNKRARIKPLASSPGCRYTDPTNGLQARQPTHSRRFPGADEPCPGGVHCGKKARERRACGGAGASKPGHATTIRRILGCPRAPTAQLQLPVIRPGSHVRGAPRVSMSTSRHPSFLPNHRWAKLRRMRREALLTIRPSTHAPAHRRVLAVVRHLGLHEDLLKIVVAVLVGQDVGIMSC